MTEDDDIDIDFENQLKKLKLSLEYGMTFGETSGENEAPPEVMRAFLDSVARFERAYQAEPKFLTMSELLGHPVWKKEEEISDLDIQAELDLVLKFLAQNHIAVGTIYEVAVRDLYRFVTVDLMALEVDAIGVEGMTTHYIYEEFHPNDEMDIRALCAEVLEAFFDVDRELYVSGDLRKILNEDPKLQNFRSSFDRFDVQLVELVKLRIDGESAFAEYETRFIGYSGSEKLPFHGITNLELEKSYDWWEILAMHLPLGNV